jgi:SAM-dependent methyltransferase
MSEIWRKPPLGYHGSIPIFSTSTDYTANYETISVDHLGALKRDNLNPFIPEELWIQTEESTRQLIRNYSWPGARILDVGVGLGRLMGPFPSLERHGIDISYGYLEVAQASGIEVCYSLISDMPYHPDFFDIIVCTDVLEHVFDLNASIKDILRVLKPNGILITRTPFREDLSWYLSADCPYRYSHLRTFEEHTLHLLLDRVFGCVFLESLLAGYMPFSGRLKYPVPFPGGSAFLGALIKLCKRFHSPTYMRLLTKLYMPIEINHVFRKP